MKNINEVIVDYKDNMASDILGEYLALSFKPETLIVCIGTDKCIGDSLGPLVGTLLKKKHFPFPIYGTLADPIHALNLDKKIHYIKRNHPLHTVIAIDACLGDKNHIGNIQIRNKPIYPGKGVGKKLPSVGDVSIIGIVDGLKNYKSLSLHSVRLSFIMDMAEVVVDGLMKAKK